MGRLFVVGSLNVDSVVAVRRHPAPGETVLGGDPQTFWGGKGANQAIAAARASGGDSRIVLIGRVGEDQPGRDYRARLASFGIDVSQLLPTPSVPTGSAVIAVNQSGENTIIVSSGANALLAPDDLEALHDLRINDVVVTTLEVPVAVVKRAAEHAAKAGARFVLNLSPFTEVPEEVVRQADPLIVNEHEEIEAVRRYGKVPSMLVTSGSRGSNWGDRHVPAATGIYVVDTTGAGDAYCGALSVSLAEVDDRARAMATATNTAADIVGRSGAQ